MNPHRNVSGEEEEGDELGEVLEELVEVLPIDLRSSNTSRRIASWWSDRESSRSDRGNNLFSFYILFLLKSCLGFPKDL